MPKRNQWNINVQEAEAKAIEEYCRENDRTPQWLFKAGAMRIVEEHMSERNADLLTIQAWKEFNEGKSEPIDDLLEMMEEDRRVGKEMLEELHNGNRKAA
jgi:tRNA uridine 5-carbamoylmethylation protein Kti12